MSQGLMIGLPAEVVVERLRQKVWFVPSRGNQAHLAHDSILPIEYFNAIWLLNHGPLGN